MLGCKMEATRFLETSGGSGYTRLDKINVGKAVEYIVSCRNLDGGFWYIAVVLLHYLSRLTASQIDLFPSRRNSTPMASLANQIQRTTNLD
ncbi:hypothetical protein WN943_010946 [Citrus x changshan-huyou]